MALRDHTLDGKITAAAREEFLQKGYTGASLRKIAEKAGVTVGAIQTRYPSKDALFADLLKPFVDAVAALFQNTKADYGTCGDADKGDDLLAGLESSMRRESEAILHLIFEHYEEAVLLLYKSAGSSMEHYYDMVVKAKIEESIAFFRRTKYSGVDEKLLGLLISVQFDCYRRIVADCPDRQAAESYMRALMVYHFGGFSALFRSVDPSKEDVS